MTGEFNFQFDITQTNFHNMVQGKMCASILEQRLYQP